LPNAPSDRLALAAVERKALELQESAASEHDATPLGAVEKLESAMQELRETRSWPLTRQPYITLRDELLPNLLSVKRFKSAFAHAAIRCIQVDPVIFPHEGHPLRRVHLWALVRITMHLTMPGEMEALTDDPFLLESFNLNLYLISCYILDKLVNQGSRSCTVPSFKTLVRSAFNEVNRGIISQGREFENLRPYMENEWRKLENLVQVPEWGML
jgi:SET and MYND domain-containing protein